MWWSVFAADALAADWVMLQGTEPPGAAEVVRPWGFLQVVGEGIVGGGPATGLSDALSAFEGERPTFDRVGSGDATWGASIRRARLGMRGALPGTDGRIVYLLSAELGDGAVTRADPVVPTDLSVTLSYIPGVRVRAGQFKLPLGEEALEANPIAAEFVNFTQTTAQLLLEDAVVGGAYVGGGSAFRDVGVELFDSFAIGRGELSYALMGSNGRMGTLDVDDPKDVTGRITWDPVVWGDRHAPHRDEVGVWLFHQQGRRTQDGVVGARVRQGLGAKVEREGFLARGELIRAVGMVEEGPSPPFPGQPVVVDPDGRAWGGYVYAHYERGPVGGGLRYDELHRDPAHVFRTATADVQVTASPKARLMVDYELRRLSAPGGDADDRAIARTMGDRLSAQVAVSF